MVTWHLLSPHFYNILGLKTWSCFISPLQNKLGFIDYRDIFFFFSKVIFTALCLHPKGKTQVCLNAISWAAPAHKRGAWLLEKFDPAFGPLKENGMSLLNGAVSELKSLRSKRKRRTAPGRTDTRHESKEMNERSEWKSTRWRRRYEPSCDELPGKVSVRGETRLRGGHKQRSHKVKKP